MKTYSFHLFYYEYQDSVEKFKFGVKVNFPHHRNIKRPRRDGS